MIEKCPDCASTDGLEAESPGSSLESFLKRTGLLKVKRCVNCNASVYVLLGLHVTSRRKLQGLYEGSFWITFVLVLLTAGYVIFEALVE